MTLHLGANPDLLPDWRADYPVPTAPAVDPLAASVIEAVCDIVIETATRIDRLHRRHRPLDGPDDLGWLEDTVSGVVRELDGRGLRDAARACEIDLHHPDAALVEALIRCLTEAHRGRTKHPLTWENGFIDALLTWRAQAYAAVSAAGR